MECQSLLRKPGRICPLLLAWGRPKETQLKRGVSEDGLVRVNVSMGLSVGLTLGPTSLWGMCAGALPILGLIRSPGGLGQGQREGFSVRLPSLRHRCPAPGLGSPGSDLPPSGTGRLSLHVSGTNPPEQTCFSPVRSQAYPTLTRDSSPLPLCLNTGRPGPPPQSQCGSDPD